MNKEQEKVYLGDDLPFIATHPGELLKDELAERKMTQKKLSELTGIKSPIISDTIKGKRSISINMAAKLEDALGIPAHIWMNMQTNYNLEVAHLNSGYKKEYLEATLYIPQQDRSLMKDLCRKFGWTCIL